MNLKEYQEDYKQNPPADDVHKTFMLSGGEDGNPMVRIPTKDLGMFPIETMCGTVGDKAFSPKLIRLLQALSSHMYAVGYLDTEFGGKSFQVFYMAIYCDSRDTAERVERLSRMRWDENGNYSALQSFESE